MLHFFLSSVGDRNAQWLGVTLTSDSKPMMDTDQAKWFLQVFADGKTLKSCTVRDLYLAGYIGIELQSAGNELLPTVITEKGKRALESKSFGVRAKFLAEWQRWQDPHPIQPLTLN